MTRDTWLKYFDAAAEPVQAYLLGEESAAAEAKAQEALGFEHDAWERVMDLVWDALFAGGAPSSFRDGLKALAGTRDPAEVEKTVSLEVLYPLADLLSWDVEARLQQLGVPASAWQGRRRVSLRPMSYGAAVRRIAADARISLLGEEIVRRLRDVFLSYVKRVRTVEQMLEILRRPGGDGGMGWSLDQSRAFLAAADALLKLVPVMSEEEYAQWLQRTQREAESERIRLAAEGKRLAAEPSVAAPPTGDAPASIDRRPLPAADASALERGVEEACALAKVEGLDEYLTKRLRNVVSTRLRGVRTTDQVREVLARDSKVGGLGRPPAEVERIQAVIEQMYAEYHERVAAQERAKVDVFVQDQQKRLQAKQETEAQEREAWYQQKVQSVAQGETGAVAALRAVMNGVRTVGPVCGPPATGVRVSVQGPGPDAGRLDGAQGIVRLMSLTEELEAMDLARFRRIAKTPEEARKKILQMFQNLRQESYDRWAEGVRRWKQSPLQRQYLEMVARAFAEQRPVAEVSEALRAEGGERLTPEEVGTIIEINQQLAA